MESGVTLARLNMILIFISFVCNKLLVQCGIRNGSCIQDLIQFKILFMVHYHVEALSKLNRSNVMPVSFFHLLPPINLTLNTITQLLLPHILFLFLSFMLSQANIGSAISSYNIIMKWIKVEYKIIGAHIIVLSNMLIISNYTWDVHPWGIQRLDMLGLKRLFHPN